MWKGYVRFTAFPSTRFSKRTARWSCGILVQKDFRGLETKREELRVANRIRITEHCGQRLDISGRFSREYGIGEQKANIRHGRNGSHTRKNRNRSHRTGTGRVSEPCRRRTSAKRSYGTRCGARWWFSPRVPRGIVRPCFIRADKSRFLLTRAVHGAAGSLRLRRCFGFARSDFSGACGSGTPATALDSMRRYRGPWTGFQSVFVHCSSGERNRKNWRVRFREQETAARTRQASPARIDARRG